SIVHIYFSSKVPTTPEIYTLSLHDALPILPSDTLYEVTDLSNVWVLADVYESELQAVRVGTPAQIIVGGQTLPGRVTFIGPVVRSEEHTSELQSLRHLVCRLLLEKKKKINLEFSQTHLCPLSIAHRLRRPTSMLHPLDTQLLSLKVAFQYPDPNCHHHVFIHFLTR